MSARAAPLPGWPGFAGPSPPLAWDDLLHEPPRPAPGRPTPYWLAAVTARLLWATRPWGWDALAAAPHADGRLRLGRAWGACDPSPPWPAEVWPAVEGRDLAGARRPRLVVVGEQRSASAPWPFHGRCGPRLWLALRELGYDELGVLATNALAPTRRVRGPELCALVEAVAPWGPRWLALGRRAAAALRAAGIEHLAAEHPQWSARFHAGEDYAARLREAGLPPGPWAGQELPAAAAGGRGRLADACALPEDIAYRPEGGRKAKATELASQAKLLEARRLYVAGEVPTLAEAARRVGAGKRPVEAAAREQGWYDEREKAEGARRQAVAAAAGDLEGRRLGEARALAWDATVGALAKVKQALLAGRLDPSTGDALRLGQLALALREAGDPPADEALRAAEAQNLAELAAEVQAWARTLTTARPGAAPGGGA